MLINVYLSAGYNGAAVSEFPPRNKFNFVCCL